MTEDFNLPKVDWELIVPKPDCSHPTFYREFLEAFNDCLLEQMVTSPTLGQNILDLFLTSNPTLKEKVFVLPGLSDYDIVMAEVNVKPAVMKQVPCNILLYKPGPALHQVKDSKFHQSTFFTTLNLKVPVLLNTSGSQYRMTSAGVPMLTISQKKQIKIWDFSSRIPILRYTNRT